MTATIEAARELDILKLSILHGAKKMNLPPWTYMIFDPDPKTVTVNVRLLASDLPSQGDRSQSIEALVKVPWHDAPDEQTVRRNALLRLQTLVDAELKRLDE